MLVRAWAWLAIVAWRMWPLLLTAILAMHQRLDLRAWWLALGATVAWQFLAYAVTVRCTGERLDFRAGLFVAAAAMSTGWGYPDMLLVPLAVLLLQCAAMPIALLPGAPARYQALVQWLVDHRMRQ